MAIASLTSPYPLLFDYLLASSWTWYAICLATIATTLRAIRVFLLRQRLVSPLPSAIASSSSESQISLPSLTEKPPLPSLSSFKRGARSKSTSALEKLHKNGEGFLRSGMELLSSVLDADFSPSLKKVTSASKLFHDHSSCEKTHQSRGLSTFSTATDNRRAEVHNLTKLGLDSDDCFGFRLGLGSNCETLVQEDEASCNCCFKEEQLPIDENVPSWLPSWASSLCDPLQFTLSFPSSSRCEDEDDSAPSQELPCFEKQFGWDRLLESKLGSSWSSLWCSRFAEQSSNVVKMWAGQQKKFLKTLDADALALDMCSRKGLACTGNIAGEIFLWELGRKAYSKATVLFPHPVVALSMNSEQGSTVVGSGKGMMGLWDQRSPQCTSLGLGSAMSAKNVSLSALKSRGSGLCIANSDNTLSIYDLRKLHGEPLYSGPAPKRAPVSSDSDDEGEFYLLEKLICDFEDDLWDEDSVSSIGNGVELQMGSSLLSWFASFMRDLATSVS